jgi:hypothetical protein
MTDQLEDKIEKLQAALSRLSQDPNFGGDTEITRHRHAIQAIADVLLDLEARVAGTQGGDED